MNSFSSASQMADPSPRTINGGSPPTAPNALTGEFTPPGIMLSARFCRRRDCSTFREMVDGMSTPAKESANNDYATDHYNSDRAAQLIRYSLFRHHSATSPRYRRFINPLLTGRVQGTASGAPGCPVLLGRHAPARITSELGVTSPINSPLDTKTGLCFLKRWKFFLAFFRFILEL